MTGQAGRLEALRMRPLHPPCPTVKVSGGPGCLPAPASLVGLRRAERRDPVPACAVQKPLTARARRSRLLSTIRSRGHVTVPTTELPAFAHGPFS